MERLVLVDGHAVLHRAYHALPKTLKTKEGRLVNAVYGFSRMLFKIISDLKPDYLAACFDLPQPTFRKKLYKGYQAKRPKMVNELVEQIEPVHQVVEAFNIPIFEKPGFEADDVIGTITRKASGFKRKMLEVVIVTGDKDIFQLVAKNVKIYALKQGLSGGELIDERKVEKVFGVKPSQVVDFKALAGDSSDNYPGVSGIGPKTAKKLLLEYGNLEEIIAKKLPKDKEAALLSRKLAQIKTNVPLEFNLEECKFALDKEKVRDVFKRFHFYSLIKKLDQEEQMRMF